jgi:methyl-accepting chemotaxis protein
MKIVEKYYDTSHIIEDIIRRRGGKEMFRKISLKLNFIVTVMMVFMLATVATLSYQISKKQIEEQAKGQAVSTLSGTKERIELYLDRYQKNMQYQSQAELLVSFSKSVNESGNMAAWTAVREDFGHYLEQYHSIMSIYVGTANKQFYAAPESGTLDPTTRGWYKAAVSGPDEVHISEVYEDALTKKKVITLSKAIMDPASDQIQGVLGMDLELTKLTDMVNETKVSHNGYSVLLNKEGEALVHPTLQGENLMDLPFIQRMYQKDEDYLTYTFQNENRTMPYTTIDQTEWKLGIVYKEKDLLKGAAVILESIVWTSAVIVVIAGVLVYLFSRTITKPILSLKKEMALVSGGDLTVEANISSKDEIGALAEFFNDMVKNMRELIGAVEKSVESVHASVEHLSSVSEEAAASSEEIGRAIGEIAQGTTQQATDADLTNHKTMMLSEKIAHSLEQNVELNELSGEVTAASETGLSQMDSLRSHTNETLTVINQVNEVMVSLTEKMNNIESIVHTIDSISDQTNLLALNASIEAARAGDVGKGFAVVAGEVRKLAEQSARATSEINEMIQTIQKETNKAAEEMKRTTDLSLKQGKVVADTESAFQQIEANVSKMAASIRDTNESMHDMSQLKGEVALSVESIAAIAQQSAAGAEEITASAEEQVRAVNTLSHSAEELLRLSEQLAGIIHRFKL